MSPKPGNMGHPGSVHNLVPTLNAKDAFRMGYPKLWI